MTFIIATVNERAATAAAVTGWWSILQGAIAASWIWSGFMLRSRDGTALATMIGLTGLASILPVVIPNDIGVTISFALFGLVFLSTVADNQPGVSHAMPPSRHIGSVSSPWCLALARSSAR